MTTWLDPDPEAFAFPSRRLPRTLEHVVSHHNQIFPSQVIDALEIADHLMRRPVINHRARLGRHRRKSPSFSGSRSVARPRTARRQPSRARLRHSNATGVPRRDWLLAAVAARSRSISCCAGRERTSVCSRCMSPTSSFFLPCSLQHLSDALETVRRGPAITNLVGISIGDHLVIRGGDEALGADCNHAAVRSWAQSRTTRSPLGPAREAVPSRSCAAERGLWSAPRYFRRGRRTRFFGRNFPAGHGCFEFPPVLCPVNRQRTQIPGRSRFRPDPAQGQGPFTVLPKHGAVSSEFQVHFDALARLGPRKSLFVPGRCPIRWPALVLRGVCGILTLPGKGPADPDQKS